MEKLPRKFVSDEELKKYLTARLRPHYINLSQKLELILAGLTRDVATGINDGSRHFTMPDATVVVAEFPQLSRVLVELIEEGDKAWQTNSRHA